MAEVCAQCGRDLELATTHVCDDRQAFELTPLKQMPSSAATSAHAATLLDANATSDDESDDNPNTALLHKHAETDMSQNFDNPNFDDKTRHEPTVRWNGTMLAIAVRA